MYVFWRTSRNCFQYITEKRTKEKDKWPARIQLTLRLTKQGDGENPNSWGQILNDGVISLADSAVAGYTQVSVGSTTSVALTQNNGSSDQSRSAFLEFTGSIGSAHTSIFCFNTQ